MNTDFLPSIQVLLYTKLSNGRKTFQSWETFFSDKNYLVNINQIHNLVITKAMIFNKGVI